MSATLADQTSSSRPSDSESNAVRGNLTFIVPQDTKPYYESSANTGGLPKLFFKTESKPVEIQDMRQIASELSLDSQGFTLHAYPTALESFPDTDEANAAYDAEIDRMLKDLTGADRVVIFDRTRRSDAPTGAENRDGMRGPADRVHVDYTVDSGPKRAADVLGADDVERVIANGGRLIQVNVWRSTAGPVRRSPLALADASSVAPSELIATDQIFPDRVGEIYSLAYGPNQRWYFAPEIDTDEVILIKGWDSVDDGRAHFTPHGAFALPDQSDASPPRESIEVRTYLIFEG